MLIKPHQLRSFSVELPLKSKRIITGGTTLTGPEIHQIDEWRDFLMLKVNRKTTTTTTPFRGRTL
ncbi:hypothetical protein A2631_00355 [Candidatus Daviesbacteria bacterium RIFCSPHIGHO2_01_FULL_44_29]|uniref:Uncharacterized protein n=1 Tax=Candidatus Daviesbacteria bacterium RIFCSPHIGHO2_02_FULL_43_12 TaxID=1797776 RepID=A0A1F5KFZ2_9BACT|nr:MAG: hypothetical protein A2631_00355 [Candidatus Daviesbacteria bacterium RIFCSPHIGHO2_01_FULL_44_29]OGE38866.1 MAG: hypothetical protein A3E86_03045 [Candidatus Daviesbacteria bacterium RIFCSPHIGHO2_12_FULL_47_45]OGE39764.1 MAG: hypothetical protein A3D25_03485 [Candidatus Daviesbacteria bacterium RIFCSPHIGHO2_02_FULL_43_12]OGE69945.1 MAG: hypothetical protein A3B55_04600 [Candidatus Daviesbacteria bacterium RIFCSPLOWO2_01_FULL_43_15]